MLLLIDNYDSFTYNLAQYLGELGEEVRVIRNDAIELDQIDALSPDRIVISPGPCTPNEAGISMDLIRRFGGEIGILGVCLGHECIAQVYGARIVRAEHVMHGKTSKVFHDEKGIFSAVENPFVATRYHSLIVDADSVPDVLETSAKTWEDEIMGVRHREFVGSPAPLEGLQFHPESIMTAAGKALLKNFIDLSRARE